jgi:hypothetical protein
MSCPTVPDCHSQLTDEGAPLVWVELDGEAPQVFLEEPENTDGKA